MKVKCIRFGEELEKAIEREAARHDRKFSDYVRLVMAKKVLPKRESRRAKD